MKTLGTIAISLVASLALASDPYFTSTGSWQQRYADQWALQALLDGDKPSPVAGHGVLIALVDTGVDYRHEDFPRHALWRNPGERANGRDDDGNGYVDDLIGWDFVRGSNNPFDQSGHGTHVAGLIAACTGNGVGIAGLAPGVTLMPLKVASFAGQARASAVAEAIDYAREHGADIINLSLGGDTVTDDERLAIAAAVDAGALVVVSAGNDATRTSAFGYAGLPGVLAIGASGLDGERAGFSPAGVHIDLLAPGVELLSLRAASTDFIALTGRQDYTAEAAVVGAAAGKEGRYYRASGTSFSTALVSAVAARVKASRPTLKGTELAGVLMASARDLAIDGFDALSGYGAVTLAPDHPSDDFLDVRLAGLSLLRAGDTVLVDLLGVAPDDGERSLQVAVASMDGNPAAFQSLALLPSGQGIARFDLASLPELGAVERWQLRLTVRRGSITASAGLALSLPEASLSGSGS